MVENKTIGMSVLALIAVSLSFLGGAQLGDDNLYYCEDRGMVMTCDSVSKYGLPNGKCNNAELGNKICKTGDGWIKVVDDTVIEVKPQSPTTLQYKCSNKGCLEV